MTFETLLFQLRKQLREKVKNGELTERGMARATGVSQPHLHNILKGIRALSPELADQLLILAGFDLPSLLGLVPATNGDDGKGPAPANAEAITEEIGTAPMNLEEEPSNFPALQLTPDASMEPHFRSGDIVYYRRTVKERSRIDAQSVYLVDFEGSVRVRYLRLGGQRLYLATDATLRDPARWDYVSLTDRHILEIVRGKIVWICRKVEEAEASAFEETRGDNRRVG